MTPEEYFAKEKAQITKDFINWLYGDYFVGQRGRRSILFREEVHKMVDKFFEVT